MVTKKEMKGLINEFDWLKIDPPMYHDVISTLKDYAKKKGIK